MRIGLFGGSFDPPHIGHQQVVRQVLEDGLFDEVWYVPVGNHDFGKKLASAEDRTAMLKLIAQPKTKIEPFELDHPEVSYTHVTLDRLQALHPEHSFSWIIGSDQLPTLDKWGCDREAACFPQLLEEFSFYVYPRAGYEAELPYANLIPLTQVAEVEVSSTLIRDRRRQNRPITDLVDPKIERYVIEHSLYLG